MISSLPCSPFIPRSPQDLPLDILSPILTQLSDRRDWYACALVSKVFNQAATPLLYRTLDSRIFSKSVVRHPSVTLLQRPDLAKYVRHVTETGAVHRGTLPRYSNVTEDTLKALALCRNLESITWIDDSSTTDAVLLSLLAVVRVHPLREICIRTHSDLGATIWSELITLTGLRKVSVWCMEGPPRVLQGWSESLGKTLTHLELGVSAYSYPCFDRVPPTILISVLSQLPKLRDLRLKGVPATAVPTILTYLVNLQSLDTEYPGTYSSRSNNLLFLPALPTLRHLTIRTSSIDSFGPQKLWAWIRELVPKPGLETFVLYAFTINSGHTSVPRMFILDLARIHGATLKHFRVGEAQLTLNDVECLCSLFPSLETLGCSVAIPDVKSLAEAISNAKKLQVLKLHVQWIPNDVFSESGGFTLQDATDLMLRSEDSELRVIAIGLTVYTGRWALEKQKGKNHKSSLRFQVLSDFAENKWQT